MITLLTCRSYLVQKNHLLVFTGEDSKQVGPNTLRGNTGSRGVLGCDGDTTSQLSERHHDVTGRLVFQTSIDPGHI